MCLVRLPIYCQMRKSKIRININYWKWEPEKDKEEVMFVDYDKATDVTKVVAMGEMASVE